MKKIIYPILFLTCSSLCFAAQEPTERVLCYQKLGSQDWTPFGFYNRTYMEYDIAILKSALEQDLVFEYNGDFQKISTLLHHFYANSILYNCTMPPSELQHNRLLPVVVRFCSTLVPEIFMVQLIRKIRLFELIELDYYPDLCLFFNQATKFCLWDI